MEKILDKVSNAELAHGKRVLHPEWEVELTQFNFKGFGDYGGRIRQYLAFANKKHFVVQALGIFELYDITRYSYRLINRQ